MSCQSPRYVAKSPRQTAKSSPRARSASPKKTYPQCFDICPASQKIFDYAVAKNLTGNALVKALVKHHSSILCAEKDLKSGKVTPAQALARMRRFIKAPADASLDQVLAMYKKNMDGVVAQIATKIPKSDVPTVAGLQKAFEETHFADLRRLINGARPRSPVMTGTSGLFNPLAVLMPSLYVAKAPASPAKKKTTKKTSPRRRTASRSVSPKRRTASRSASPRLRVKRTRPVSPDVVRQLLDNLRKISPRY